MIGLALLVAIGGVVALSSQAWAATPFSIENVGGSLGLTSTDLKGVVLNVIRWVLGILTLVAVSFIIYGGFLWLTAAGNEQRIEKAKRVILNAVVGLVIVLIAWAIVFFVARTILNTTGGNGGDNPPACCLPPGGNDVGFEIRSITTDCTIPGDYRSDVYRCSAVQVNFNHPVDAATVQQAVENGTLVLKQCADDTCADSGLTVPENSALDGDPAASGPGRQAYSPNVPTGTKGEWVAKSDNSGKTVTFHHQQALFAATTSFHLSVPTTIKDTDGKVITNCQISTGVPVPGCIPDPGVGTPTRFTWTMKVGTNVDTTSPKATSTYPDSRYLADSAYRPDRNVPLAPILSARYDQAIIDNISQGDIANPLNNTVAVIPFTAAPNEDTGAGGTLGAPLSPSDFTVVPFDDNLGLQIQIKPNVLTQFTWYKIVIRNIRDLCANVQAPEPLEWVFETNDVVPAIADHFPQNGTGNACGDTPVFIRYTMSMYDVASSTCSVPQGYVTQGTISPAPTTPRTFDVDPSQSCNGCASPQTKCMVYTFTPPPPVPPTSGVLSPGTTYSIGVDNRFAINDQGATLRFGSGPWGDAALGAWKFDVKPAGSCVNPPVITSIDPPQGTDGQCISVNGFNFDPNADGRTGADALTYDGTDVAGGNVLSWNNGQIAAETPAGSTGTKNVTVRAEFPSPFGALTSPIFPWTKIAGPESTGPCLAGINPASGYNLDNVTLSGKRFGANPPTKQVRWDGVTQNNPPVWNDVQIATSVPPAPPAPQSLNPPDIVNVSVRNDQGTSNTVQFDLREFIVPPGTVEPPVVADRWPNCGSSCVNADVGVRLAYPSGTALTMDAATLTAGSAILRRCTDDSCAAYVGGDITPALAYDGPATNLLHFPPSASLLPDTSYRVILKGTIKDTAGTGLGQLNFDLAGGGSNDSYSWIFKTQGGTGGCRLQSVSLAPNPDFFSSAGQQHLFSGSAFSEPNSCSASGQPLNPTSLTWSWSSDPVYATVSATANPWNETVTAVDETVPGPPTVISGRATDPATGITRVGNSNVTIDFSTCDETTDCTRGGICGGSVCDEATRQCTPVITSMSPTQGAAGTWVTVNGCYFDSYASGRCQGGTNDGAVCNTNNDCDSQVCSGGSAVIFSGDKRNLWPNPGLCGAPSVQWQDDHVTVEVPDRNNASATASSGPVVIQRWDGVRSNASADSFIVDPAAGIPPGICSVAPNGGSDGTQVTISGQQFGNTRAAGDRVVFYQENDVPAGDISAWSSSQVVCRAPTGIANNTDPNYAYPTGHAWGTNEIAIQAGGRWSNVANFNVVPPGCQVCSNDAVCGAGNSCGYNGCCTSSPTVTATSPGNGEMNVCRNTVVTATFSRAMDAGTLNSSTVHILKGGVEVPSSVNYDPATRRVSISAGLLDRNTTYTVSLSRGNILQNPSFESGPGVGWSGPDASISTDLPPGAVAGSRSVLVNGTSGTQAYQVQNTGVESSLRRTYHVTGWVKYRNVSAPNTSSAGGGLITRCWGSGAASCDSSGNGFDQYDGAFVDANTNFGLFRQNSTAQNTWHRIDFTVTNNTGASVAPSVLCFANAGSQVWCDDVIVTEVGASGIRAADGGNLTASQWTFQTADAAGPCGVARVVVAPSQWNFSAAAQPRSFTARAYADSGLEVSKIPGVYDWTWNWSVVDPTIADFTAAPGNADTVSVAALPKKGTTFLKATAQPLTPAQGLTSSVGGLATLTSTACENLWLGSQFTDSAGNCRPGSGVCNDYHFNLSYCMDDGQPNLDLQTITGANGALLKEFLFKQSNQSSLEAIGIRIYDNSQGRSVREWYNENAPNPNPSAQSIQVDGYDAVRDGRSIYVGATDFNGTSFVPRIYLISVTQNPSPGLQSVFDQMLQNWFFNTNVNGVCHDPDSSDYTIIESDKTCIQRDLKRLAALSDITQRLRAYKATNGNYPSLQSGSFLSGLSFSVWPSWQNRLGASLSTNIPVDPSNKIASCPAGQAQDGTCWNETSKRFVCLPSASDPSQVQSQILGYRAASDGSTAALYANLEYRGPGNWLNLDPTTNLCSSPSSCACFNYSFGP